MSVCRRILARGPQKLVVHSLRQAEAEDAAKELAAEFPQVQIVPGWGDIFVREQFKDISRKEVMADHELRWQFVQDVYEKLTPERLKLFYLYNVIIQHRPDVIVDCVNAATGFAYQDIYAGYYDLKPVAEAREKGLKPNDPFFETIEKFAGTVYVPQLIRHIQVLLEATMQVGVHTYVKVGTTGTGGMGLNIPYTHSEEKPSSQLLAKSSMAGAHSMLLFLMGRTPGCPYIKEIKPGAAIAWKKIAFGEIKRGGKPIPLYDCPPEKAQPLGKKFTRIESSIGEAMGENLKSVYIDTGENGIFSADEFYTITAAQQMEFVTPEEISQSVLWEIEGGNSGMDIIGALDATVMGPTYRAGILRQAALEEMKRLEKETNTASVAFEMLGPPHLSKLLYEAYLLKLAYPDPSVIPNEKAETLAEKVWQILKKDKKLRATIISIGVPILLPDGQEHPARAGSEDSAVHGKQRTADWIRRRSTNGRTKAGWICGLRACAAGRSGSPTFTVPRARAADHQDTSSGYPWERRMLGDGDEYFAGRLVTHIFIDEEKGGRIKS